MSGVRLSRLPEAAIHALAAGDLATANRLSGFELPASFVEEGGSHVWLMRSKQIEADPDCAQWITRAIVDTASGDVVGRAGFHGPPDADGMLEVGYAVDPRHRRKGYARAAFEVLLAWARADASTMTLRATIRPDNAASYNLIAQYPFTRTGEQWDDIDGREIIYDMDVRGLALGGSGRRG